MSEAAKRSWRTRKKKNTGRKVAEHRRQLTVKVKDILKDWSKNVEGKKACVVCGDGVPKTILQTHHLDPYDKSGERIWLCASCHNIFNKAGMTTTLKGIKRDLESRHKRLA